MNKENKKANKKLKSFISCGGSTSEQTLNCVHHFRIKISFAFDRTEICPWNGMLFIITEIDDLAHVSKYEVSS